ncbi:homeobox domain containing [Brachionus plicatilis]|uniref:Homeobox domain containing n=1 Tax=Brachionus plicatilis TaxID=10195 RepID=A0A3M7R6A1_BRAPC|nr:homeobox domain containing [Brachionus plicatilis]
MQKFTRSFIRKINKNETIVVSKFNTIGLKKESGGRIGIINNEEFSNMFIFWETNLFSCEKSLKAAEKAILLNKKKNYLKKTYVLEHWFLNNSAKPYPDIKTKKQLAKESNFTYQQLNQWFKYKRKCMKNKAKGGKSKSMNLEQKLILSQFFFQKNQNPKNIIIKKQNTKEAKIVTSPVINLKKSIIPSPLKVEDINELIILPIKLET